MSNVACEICHSTMKPGYGGWVCPNRDNHETQQPTESIAAEADRIINGERREAYGPIEESALDLAAIWTVILRKKLSTAIEPREVMLMMTGLKLQRESNSEKRDNRVDLIGYTLLADKLSKK